MTTAVFNIGNNQRGYTCKYFILVSIYLLFLDRGEGRERKRERSMYGCLSQAPYRGPGLQHRHVP